MVETSCHTRLVGRAHHRLSPKNRRCTRFTKYNSDCTGVKKYNYHNKQTKYSRHCEQSEAISFVKACFTPRAFRCTRDDGVTRVDGVTHFPFFNEPFPWKMWVCNDGIRIAGTAVKENVYHSRRGWSSPVVRVLPRCLKAWGVATRPWGVRFRKPIWMR